MEYIKYILILIFISVISFAEAQCPPGTAPTGTNLVLNGDFSQGDIGFGSGYSTGTGGAFGLVTNSGQYAIVTNPGLAHTNFASFGDHTSGTGNMMVINGSGAANVSIWCQTISVKPFTTYNFSTWIATAVSSSPAILQFSINGVNTGFPFAASSNTGQWQQFFTNWYSGSNLTANICIVNQNTSTFGNDFAIDDIFFEECDCIVQPAAGPDTTVCEGATVQLYATGGNNYQWLPVTGLNNSTIANPVATVSSNSLYYVIISSTYCIDTVSVSINVNPYPVVDAGADDSICAGTNLQLNGNGNGNISWSPTTGLSDPTILNPVASPAQTTMYLLTVEANGCESVDTVTIAVKPAPYVSAGTDKIICGGESVQLNGSGSGIISWSPSTGLSDPSILNPVASPTQTTNYILTVDSGGCENMDTITVIVTPLPAVNAGNDQVMCKGDSVQLNASGTGNITWFPASGLSDPTIFNPVASPGQTITYTLTVEEGGCESVDSVTVTVKPLPQIDAGADLSVCEGDSIQLSATGSGTISWFPSISLDNPSVINPVAFPLQTTVYTLTVDSGGCTNVDSMTLTVIPLPPVNAGMDDTICSGKSVQLNGQGTGSISWSPATVLNNSSILNPVATLIQTTTFSLTVVANGCANIDSVTIIVKPLPQINAGADVSICEGDSIQLNGSGSGLISWTPTIGLNDPGVINPIASPLTTTNYVLTIDSGGCENADTVIVIVIPLPPVSAGNDVSICAGDSIQLNAVGATDFQWTPDEGLSNSFISSPVASPIVTTTYFLTGIENGCASSDSLTVFVNPLPEVFAGNDTMVNYNINFILSGIPSYGSWSKGTGMLCSGCTTYSVFTEDDEEYFYAYIDSNGCSNTDTIQVFVNKSCPEPIFPNAFTPNNDFINDFFKPVFDNINVISEVELIIYNRWGEQVFLTKSIDEGWDGGYSGRNQNMDMFIYKFIYNCKGQTKVVNGRLLLIK